MCIDAGEESRQRSPCRRYPQMSYIPIYSIHIGTNILQKTNATAANNGAATNSRTIDRCLVAGLLNRVAYPRGYMRRLLIEAALPQWFGTEVRTEVPYTVETRCMMLLISQTA